MNQWIVSLIFFVNSNFIECQHYTVDEGEVTVGNGPGLDIHLKEYPFFGFFIDFEHETQPPLCIGSIIHVRWVLTSTQCLQIIERYFDDTVFMYGKTNSNYTIGPVYNWPTKIFPHDNYKIYPDLYTENDIGLAQLKYKIEWSDQQRPIRIPNDNSVKYQYRFGTYLHWANYSSALPWNIKMKRICLIDERDCSILSLNPDIDYDKHICGSDYDEDIWACTRDAGAPLVLGHELIGIVSLFKFEDCFDEWHPITFTRVSAHIDWIKHILRKEGQDSLDSANIYWN